ncbi:MAG: DUF302 domain-containing protein [Candidatus Zixiibacteriota bacterium]|nr:MAG: DUF302 domain-containing protein [candidate division Zixibacteria bacterium]
MGKEFVYELKSEKSFGEVVSNIETGAPQNGFRVLAVHDVQKTLAEKGLERGPLKIIEVCNGVFAHQALNLDADVSMFMPCRYSVYEDSGKTVVKLNRPSMIAEMLPEAGLESLAAEVEKTLRKIMQESV